MLADDLLRNVVDFLETLHTLAVHLILLCSFAHCIETREAIQATGSEGLSFILLHAGS
jgi:hypothetical protein